MGALFDMYSIKSSTVGHPFFVVLICAVFTNHAFAQSQKSARFIGGHMLRGNESMEEVLGYIDSIYTLGFPPGAELRSRSIPYTQIPQEYIKAVRHDLGKIIKNGVFSEEQPEESWLGCSKLTHNIYDGIYGKVLLKRPPGDAEFICDCLELGITLHSLTIFTKEPAQVSQKDILGYLMRFFAIPLLDVPRILVQINRETTNSVPFVYGQIIDMRYQDKRKPPSLDVWWLGSIEFWYAKGSFFACFNVRGEHRLLFGTEAGSHKWNLSKKQVNP